MKYNKEKNELIISNKDKLKNFILLINIMFLGKYYDNFLFNLIIRYFAPFIFNNIYEKNFIIKGNGKILKYSIKKDENLNIQYLSWELEKDYDFNPNFLENFCHFIITKINPTEFYEGSKEIIFKIEENNNNN